jgi:hypothetical protein
MNKLHPIYRQTRAALVAEANALDIDTTVANGAGVEADGSGNHEDRPVATNQTPQDAGASHPTTVDADRLPGETSGSVAESKAVGLFAGNFVRVVEKSNGKTVDRGVVRKVHKGGKDSGYCVELQGDEKGGPQYDEDKFRFVRLA